MPQRTLQKKKKNITELGSLSSRNYATL